jgi:hypothetical protein
MLVVAAVVLATNIINMVLWSVGSSVPPILYGLYFAAFAVFTIGSTASHRMILALFVLFTLIILGGPVFDWDARSIWFFHAKRIFIDNDLYAQLDDYAPWSHNDYPVLVSALAASLAKGVGYWNEIFPRLSVLFVLFPVFLVFARLIADRLLFGVWVVGALAIGGVYLLNGYMDAILALYCAGCALLILAVPARGRFGLRPFPYWQGMILLGLMLATLPLIKNEGVLALSLFCLCLVPRAYPDFRLLMLLPLGWLIYYWLWKQPVLTHQIPTHLLDGVSVARFLSRLFNVPDMLEIMGRLLNYSGLYLVGFVLFLIAGRSTLRLWWPVVLFIGLYCVAIVAIYIITPYPLVLHLNTSADRTLLVVNMCIYSLILYAFAELGPGLNSMLSERSAGSKGAPFPATAAAFPGGPESSTRSNGHRGD